MKRLGLLAWMILALAILFSLRPSAHKAFGFSPMGAPAPASAPAASLVDPSTRLAQLPQEVRFEDLLATAVKAGREAVGKITLAELDGAKKDFPFSDIRTVPLDRR